MLDAYHQIGIPPYCDMFNHSTESAQTSLLCDEAVCPTCGSLQRCNHDGGDENEKPARLRKLKSDYLAKMKANGEDEQVDMRAERAIAAGVEVFSCYEEDLSSGKALVGYGFAPPEPTRSRVSWYPSELMDERNSFDWSRVTGYGRVEDALYGSGQAENVQVEHLFKPAGSAHIFDMDGDGTLSINIFVALHIQASADHDFHHYSLEAREKAILNDEKALRLAAESSSGSGQMECGDGLLVPILERLVQLMEDRLKAMYRPELSPEALEKEILVSHHLSATFVTVNVG